MSAETVHEEQMVAYAVFIAEGARRAHRRLIAMLDLIEPGYDGLRRAELTPVLRDLEPALYSPTFDLMDGSMWVHGTRVWPVAAVFETRDSVSVAAPSEASRSLLPTPATAEPESGEKAEGAAAQGFQRPPQAPGDGRHAR